MLRPARRRRHHGPDSKAFRADARRPRLIAQHKGGGCAALANRRDDMMTRKTRTRTVLRAALLAGALGLSAPAFAQLTTATIRGTVAAAAAQGTTVTAVNVET